DAGHGGPRERREPGDSLGHLSDNVRDMTVNPDSPRDRHPRKAILGQLPKITRADGSPIRVLLVDDEPALTNLVTMALHYEGWTVDVAHNGREAITKFSKLSPDV